MKALVFTVVLPNGDTHELRGKYAGIAVRGQEASPVIEDRRGGFTLIDPRAIILDARRFVYNPREAPRPLAPWVLAYLAAHPEWPDQAFVREVIQ